MDIHFSQDCPECKATNYFVQGYTEGDLSGIDIDGGRCWNCKHEWVFDTEFFDISDAVNIEDGNRKPLL